MCLTTAEKDAQEGVQVSTERKIGLRRVRSAAGQVLDVLSQLFDFFGRAHDLKGEHFGRVGLFHFALQLARELGQTLDVTLEHLLILLKRGARVELGFRRPGRLRKRGKIRPGIAGRAGGRRRALSTRWSGLCQRFKRRATACSNHKGEGSHADQKSSTTCVHRCPQLTSADPIPALWEASDRAPGWLPNGIIALPYIV